MDVYVNMDKKCWVPVALFFESVGFRLVVRCRRGSFCGNVNGQFVEMSVHFRKDRKVQRTCILWEFES